jgi:hypothetical protein
MKQVTLNIPDSKFQFFMELIKNLGFKESVIDIPEEHKEAVRKRMEASSIDPERLLNWEEVQNEFRL